MCVTGKPIKAPEALAAGLVDEVDRRRPGRGRRSPSRARVAQRRARSRRPATARERLGTPAANAPLFAAARELAGKVRRHQTAPLKAIDAIEAASDAALRGGLPPRTRAVRRVGRTEQAKALIHAFFAERAATKLPGVPTDLQAAPDRTGRDHRRRNDGRRDHHGLRQRRHAGDDHRRQPGGARSRARDDPPQLRLVGQARPAHRRRRHRAPRRASPRTLDDAGLRRGGSRDRSGLREHGAEEAGVRERRRGGQAGLRCSPPTRPRSTSTRSPRATERPAAVVGLHFFSPAQRDAAGRDRPRRARPARRCSRRVVAFAKQLGKVPASSSATARGSSATA